MKDENGMVLETGAATERPFIVGVGDPVSELKKRNPYLASISADTPGGLRLPLLLKLNSVYDDGDIVFSLGCTTTANIDGDQRIDGVTSAGFVLCDPSETWSVATKRAAALMGLLEAKPGVTDLKSFFETASEDERRKIGGPYLLKKSQASWNTLRSEEEANAYFSQLLKEPGSDGHGSTMMGIYLGKKAIVIVGVNGDKRFAGENLTEAQRAAMWYRVSIGFYLRYDVDQSR